jgi:D-alanine-D-alanine ligase
MTASLRVLIVHNAVAEDATEAERDVLTQVAVVERACRALGYEFAVLPCSTDLQPLIAEVERYGPDVVFNLVEALAGRDQLAWLVPAAFETLGVPCTGTPAAPLNLSNDKLRTKERLRLAGLPTPAWYARESLERNSGLPTFAVGQYIVKAVGEHASLGLDDSAVVRVSSAAELLDRLRQQSAKLGKPCFAEQFIAGREFNLALLADGKLPQVLPPAEIDFSAFPAGKPHIVGHAAKWDEGSFEYDHTPRVFDFPNHDEPLLARLRSLARSCWQVLELAGWARVDFRVDEHDQPWILEVNTNCCISPDAGFAAAVEHAGLTMTSAIERIIAAAVKPRAVANRQPDTSKLKPAISDSIQLRTTVTPDDEAHVREIVAATGMFRPAEVDVAADLVRVRLRDGVASGYEFVFADQFSEQGNHVLGYVCFGKNAVTVASYDLYWIAVRPEAQGRGIGQLLLREVEERIAAAGGKRIYIETSARPDYAATRGFYERCGYVLEAVLRDFYAPSDDKAVFVRRIETNQI